MLGIFRVCLCHIEPSCFVRSLQKQVKYNVVIFGKNNSQGQNKRTIKVKRLHEPSEKDINLCTRYPARQTYN